MRGQMMDFPLTLHHIFDRAVRLYATREIVTRTGPGTTHRYDYGAFGARVRRLSGALRSLGLREGDRVGTFAWNSHRHLEAYFAVPCAGMVLHTINFRLFPDQVAEVVNHAEDRVILVDAPLLKVLAAAADQFRTVEHVVVMSNRDDVDAGAWSGATLDYEELLAKVTPMDQFPKLDESAAMGICYTTGTTGEPKGVLYSHRSVMLHAFGQAMVDSFGMSEHDVAMPVVPMFHVNAWGMPFSCAMVGAKQVFPGPTPTPSELVQLIESERVTISAGVPTVWIGVQAALEREPHDVSSLQRLIVGGSAVPSSLIEAWEKQFGVPIHQAWGMTEMSPLGTISRLRSHHQHLNEAERIALRAKQGTPLPGVEVRVVADDGSDLPWDGGTVGELLVRGPWVAASYYRRAESEDRFTTDGWLRTGDMVTITDEGYVQVVDRTKDLVKSGGEWISSVELENALMGHPKVLEAAVVARPDPKWGERPVAFVVPRPGEQVSQDELKEHLRPRVPSWWIPEEMRCVDEIPKTGVGKFDKKVMRQWI